MTDLFGSEAKHDPGGKVRTALPAGMRGDAEFSPCGRYRYWLSRQWGNGSRFALFVGMNPSTATGDLNDPTITREIGFTKNLGLDWYIKMNVGDYRATNPNDLAAHGVVPCSDGNLSRIIEMASEAAFVIMAHGILPQPLQPAGRELIHELKSHGLALHCFGTTKAGWPRHLLYVKGDARLVSYTP